MLYECVSEGSNQSVIICHWSVAIHVLQNYRATTPERNVSRKNRDQLKKPPTKKTEEITPQFADQGNINEVMHIEAESNMISEAEMDPESEEMSEAETDLENAGEEKCWNWKVGLPILVAPSQLKCKTGPPVEPLSLLS